MLIVRNIKLSIDEPFENIRAKVKKILKLNSDDFDFKIIKESIDARKSPIEFLYHVEVDINFDEKKIKKFKNNNIAIKAKEEKLISNKKIKKDIIVIGSGPSGLFCGYLLAKEGFKPLIIERGKDVENRKKDVDLFFEKGILNSESNVQFGEGGAGTFSDGKLTTRSKDKLVNEVFKIFVENGADESILYKHKAHIGTDVLINVVKKMRENIIKMGGRFAFEEKLIDLEIDNNKIVKIKTDKDEYITSNLVLAIGHSARDTIRMLNEKNLDMIQKAFAVGFRIEHPQIMINKVQYGNYHNHPRLGQAEYALAKNINDRGVYTFCMCPGGRVIAAASDEKRLCVNGMSYQSRDLENANSAILTTVDNKDYGDELFAGMKFQEEIEEKAFVMGGENYFAPVQRVKDFLEDRKSENIGGVSPSYTPGYVLSNLNELYPKEITLALKEGIKQLGRSLKGFDMDDAILTAVETRSSSPIRVLRDKESLESNISGIYCIGEGAGFSGGIVSSAVDGLKIAIKLIEK